MPENAAQHVVVTGASAGAGRAAAIAFADRGWKVTLIARGAAGLEGARAEVERHGGAAHSILADVADAEAVEAAAEEAERIHGPIDVWVNSAMATVFGPVSKITAEEFARVTDVTYHGQVHGTMSALKRMRVTDRGTIVNVGSALAYHGLCLQAAYCGAKFAVRGFTESLRSELIHEGSDIRLSLVILPALNTPQFSWARNKMPERPRPVAPVFDPDVAGRAIVRAARFAPRELVVGGSSLKLMAGSAIAPGYIDRMLARIGWSGQMVGQPAGTAPDNLFEPVDAETDFGTRGSFDDEARAATTVISGRTARLGAAAAALPLAYALFKIASGTRRHLRKP